ncbi:MAG: 3-deoxy-8-phosphooctulonate synthase [Alphaproteobacteria bacterium]
MIREIIINNFKIANNLPLTLIAGPCQMESEQHAIKVAEFLVDMSKNLGINFIYKSSFDKANRTSANSQRGIGLEKSLAIFGSIKEKFGCPVLTDVHTEEQCKIIAQTVDILQIPAFLCRQTDLLKAAAETGKIVNVKKGQFLSPYDMKNIVNKLDHFGNKDIMLTERGACFGYNNLVSDMRSLPIMAETGAPIVFDATHSVQQPGGAGNASGGERKFVETLAKAAVAVGVAAIFIETHPDPDNAPSDGPCMIALKNMPILMSKLIAFDKLAKGY